MEFMELMNQAMQLMKQFGEMAGPAKVAGVITLMLSVWKSSIVRPYWDKIGGAKVLVAPVLGLLLACYQMPEVSFKMVWGGIQSGLLAVAFHEVMNALKNVPKFGPKYEKFIDFVDGMLFRPKVQKK